MNLTLKRALRNGLTLALLVCLAVGIDEAEARRRMYRAPTPRERERWHALWLLAQGWTAAAVARALDRDAHTIGQWTTAFAEGGPAVF